MSSSTSGSSIEEAHLIGQIDNKLLEKFALEKLELPQSKYDELQNKEMTQLKLSLVALWKEKDPDEKNNGNLVHLVQQFTRENESLPRPMRYARKGKGCALIISNSFATSRQNASRQESSKKDLKLMEDLWKDTLNCVLLDEKAHEDKTAEEMKDLLKKLASINERRKAYDYVVIVISTHGNLITEERMVQIGKNLPVQQSEPPKKKVSHGSLKREENSEAAKERPTVEVFYGNDDHPVRQSEVMEYFNNNQAPGLRHIPKFFILNYCRGDKEPIVRIRLTGPKGTLEYGATPESYIKDEVPLYLPVASDVLVAFATHRDHCAYDETLIPTIASVFESQYQSQHAVAMLTEVNRKIKSEARWGMSVFQSSFEKELWF